MVFAKAPASKDLQGALALASLSGGVKQPSKQTVLSSPNCFWFWCLTQQEIANYNAQIPWWPIKPTQNLQYLRSNCMLRFLAKTARKEGSASQDKGRCPHKVGQTLPCRERTEFTASKLVVPSFSESPCCPHFLGGTG